MPTRRTSVRPPSLRRRAATSNRALVTRAPMASNPHTPGTLLSLLAVAAGTALVAACTSSGQGAPTTTTFPPGPNVIATQPPMTTPGTIWERSPDPCTLIDTVEVSAALQQEVVSAFTVSDRPGQQPTPVCVFSSKTPGTASVTLLTFQVLPPADPVIPPAGLDRLVPKNEVPGLGKRAVVGLFNQARENGETDTIFVDMGNGGFSIFLQADLPLPTDHLIALAQLAADRYLVL